MKTKPSVVGNAKYVVFCGLEMPDVLRKLADYLDELDIDMTSINPVPITVNYDDEDSEWTLACEVDYWFDGVKDDED